MDAERDVAGLELATVSVQLEGGIGVLTLRRPQAKNSITPELADDLVEATAWCAERPLDGLVVTGAGGAFCTGGDLEALQRGVTDPLAERCRPAYLAGQLAKAVTSIYELTCPSVAAVHGRAGGGGFSLALACDARLASERAVFDFAYARIGATPDGGMTWFLPQLLGPSRAAELLIEAPIVRAAEAQALGLVRDVLPPAQLLDGARSLVRRMARNSPHYIAAVKRLVHPSGLAARLDEEQRTIERSLAAGPGRQRLVAGPNSMPPE